MPHNTNRLEETVHRDLFSDSEESDWDMAPGDYDDYFSVEDELSNSSRTTRREGATQLHSVAVSSEGNTWPEGRQSEGRDTVTLPSSIATPIEEGHSWCPIGVDFYESVR